MMLSRRGHSISLLSLGVLTFTHALLVFTVVPGYHDVLVLLALILFSLSFNTMILSVVARQWAGSRITCWIGLLRLILCLSLLGPVAEDPERAFYAIALLIVVSGLLEAFIWIQARIEQSQLTLTGMSALANILLGSYALINYHWRAADHIIFAFGLSLAISAIGPISASIVVRRTEDLALSVLQQTSATHVEPAPVDHESLARLSIRLDTQLPDSSSVMAPSELSRQEQGKNSRMVLRHTGHKNHLRADGNPATSRPAFGTESLTDEDIVPK